ncbi:hypothetical protein MTO96_006035 [Rhipicephalus appendiculatus]
MQRLHREMEDRIYKRGEPIECYYYDKLAKARRCNLSEEACIEYLITGLNNQDTIRAISTRTYDSPEELLCCLKRLEERVGTVGSRDPKHFKASEFQNLAGHGNKEHRAAETALNESNQYQQNSAPRKETEPGGRGATFATEAGHEARNCRERESGPRLFQSAVELDIRAADAANEKYFMLAKVNGNEVRAYVDLGSQCVTIRREDADRIGIRYSVMEKPLTIGGYGSGRVTPCGQANVNLTVDQATADVPVLIVPNESQAIPIIVGQPFTEQPHVTVVRRRNSVRIFEEEKNVDESDDTLQSIKIPYLPRRPVCLWSKESTVVPPNYVGIRQALRYGQRTQRRCFRGRPTEELSIKANERVARAEVCYLDEEPMQDFKSGCSTTQPCPTATASVKAGPGVTPEHREKLYRLIEEYRDCFADSVAEIGHTTAAEMKIEITAEEPVRWWLRIQEFTFDIEYRKGATMAHVDALSRSPCDPPDETEVVGGLQVLATCIEIDDCLAIAQQNDPDIQILKERLSRRQHLSNEDRRVQSEYQLSNGKLFKKVHQGDSAPRLLWVVPRHARWRVVKACHDDIGHFAVEKTLSKLKETYWFPGMKRYVRRYIAACIECLFHKVPAGKRPGKLHSIDKVGKPFHSIHIDHLGPFVRSKSGNAYILVAVDGFTKFVLLRAVRNTSAGPATQFLRDVAGIFGPPTMVITDRGSAFTSAKFKATCDAFSIKHVKNATATPRANGQVERYNRMITPAVASLTNNTDGKDWDTTLPQVQWGINSTLHQATKTTPFGLLFNYRPRNINGDCVDEALTEEFDRQIEAKRTSAAESIREDQRKQQARYNKKRSEAPAYGPGDVVLDRARAYSVW